MADLYKNKIVFGGDTLIDLTEDTVSPEMLMQGITAHSASGMPIVGTAYSGARELGELSDVNLTNPADGQALTYDAANDEWINTTIGSGLVFVDDGSGAIIITESGGTDFTFTDTGSGNIVIAERN